MERDTEPDEGLVVNTSYDKAQGLYFVNVKGDLHLRNAHKLWLMLYKDGVVDRETGTGESLNHPFREFTYVWAERSRLLRKRRKINLARLDFQNTNIVDNSPVILSYEVRQNAAKRNYDLDVIIKEEQYKWFDLAKSHHGFNIIIADLVSSKPSEEPISTAPQSSLHVPH